MTGSGVNPNSGPNSLVPQLCSAAADGRDACPKVNALWLPQSIGARSRKEREPDNGV